MDINGISSIRTVRVPGNLRKNSFSGIFASAYFKGSGVRFPRYPVTVYLSQELWYAVKGRSLVGALIFFQASRIESGKTSASIGFFSVETSFLREKE